MLIAPQNDVPSVRRRWTLLVATRASFGHEPGLTAVGVAGMLLRGMPRRSRRPREDHSPGREVLDAATFAFSIGVYTLWISLLLPLAGYSRSARTRWRRLFYVFVVYGYAVETTQAFRGLDPRFSDEGEQVDAITGAVFGVDRAPEHRSLRGARAPVLPQHRPGGSTSPAARHSLRRRRGHVVLHGRQHHERSERSGGRRRGQSSPRGTRWACTASKSFPWSRLAAGASHAERERPRGCMSRVSHGSWRALRRCSKH